MKLFGEYLIEQKLITEADLLNALIKQIQMMPSVAEIIYEEKILDISQLLKILTLQAHEKIEFKAAALKLGFWSDAIDEAIGQIYKKRKKPLGHILYSDGKLSLQNLTKSFDEFISVHAKENLAVIAEPVPMTYVSLFNEFKRNEIELYIQINDKGSFAKEIQILKGAAHDIKADVSENILSEIENSLKSDAELTKLSSSLTQKIEVLWKLRNILKTEKSESGAWSDAVLKQEIESILNIKTVA